MIISWNPQMIGGIVGRQELGPINDKNLGLLLGRILYQSFVYVNHHFDQRENHHMIMEVRNV